MIDAAIKALSQMFAPALRHVLLKAVGLTLILITIIGILMQRVLAAWAETGANWAEQAAGVAPHAAWSALAWLLSIMAGLGIITGALFLMPAVTAFVGSFLNSVIPRTGSLNPGSSLYTGTTRACALRDAGNSLINFPSRR